MNILLFALGFFINDVYIISWSVNFARTKHHILLNIVGFGFIEDKIDMNKIHVFVLLYSLVWLGDTSTSLEHDFSSNNSTRLITVSYVEERSPDPPIYPPRWTATAHFQFVNASNHSPAGSGILYQIIDSNNQKFRADDLYFGGTFPIPYDTFFSSSSPDEAYQYYASMTSNGISCVVYPGRPTTLSQNWIAELCSYNSTIFYDNIKAYRWNCATDVVTWFIDTAALDGRLIYQYTLPQPLFDVYQYLWFTNYTVVQDEIDQTVFIPPQGWNCSASTTNEAVKYSYLIMFPFISIFVWFLSCSFQ